MSLWESFFKPETRHSGDRFISKDLVSVSSSSDTEVNGFIRATSAFKISLKSKSIASTSFSATCSCPASQRGQLCKHIWAVVSLAHKKFPDFFQEKKEIEAPLKRSSEKNSYQLKQASFRKAQYQKMKELKKNRDKKSKAPEPEYPVAIEKAVHYFRQNGFEFVAPVSEEQIQSAKKKLSRLFHPDLGGSHEEIVQLNTQSEVLLKYFKNKF